MSRNGPHQVDVFRAILLVQSPANIGVHILIEWLQLLPQSLQVFLKGRGLIEGAPKSPVVRVTYRMYQGFIMEVFAILSINRLLMCSCHKLSFEMTKQIIFNFRPAFTLE